jgi:hypothetical protein
MTLISGCDDKVVRLWSDPQARDSPASKEKRIRSEGLRFRRMGRYRLYSVPKLSQDKTTSFHSLRCPGKSTCTANRTTACPKPAPHFSFRCISCLAAGHARSRPTAYRRVSGSAGWLRRARRCACRARAIARVREGGPGGWVSPEGRGDTRGPRPENMVAARRA